MADYRHHPDVSYGIEIRDGWSEADYIANARGFSTTAEFLEYRDASAERQEEMRRNRDDKHPSANADDDDLRRYVKFLRISK